MTFGASAFGSSPLGGGPTPLFSANFDLDASAGNQKIIEVVSYVDRALISHLSRYPDELRTVNRRFFEELVAELFVGFGYEVELTKRTRDGGKDIIAIKRMEVNTRFLIECKRPDPGNPVRLATVRELYGVLSDDKASKAILATTSHFTSDAQVFIDKHRWELEGRDFDAIQSWISDYLNRGR